uniref:hypothetical protein n=1 Tax=Ningiella ruwaisensis TaxID=2364274 RepID=UPI0010A05DF9|nr:hypothetical protein [Ningiella ruwaisensis]
MDYSLDVNNMAVSDDESHLIDTRIGLTLSRYANLIEQCHICLLRQESNEDSLPVECKINLLLHAGHEIQIRDRARNTEYACTQALQRCKRAIERHLKHHRGVRLGSSITSRT